MREQPNHKQGASMSKVMEQLSPALNRERRQLCVDANGLKERLFRAGLYLTARSMDKTTRQIGWEVAALEQGKKPKVQP